MLIALKILENKLTRILLQLIVQGGKLTVAVFNADYPDIFFMLLVIVKKKILKILFSKIIKVYKNFRKTILFKVSKFQNN